MRKIDLKSLGVSLDEVKAALARERRPHVRRRLVAIRAILAGKSIRQAQEITDATRESVDRWEERVRRGGLQALVLERRGGRQGRPTLQRQKKSASPRPPKIDADPTALREWAAAEKNPRIRKRMLALACVAEGESVLAAAVSTKVAHSALLARVKRFQKEGLAALQDRPPFGRPRKLTEAQVEELRLVALDHPEMTYRHLCDFVGARFGVGYSNKGLERLLKKDLAIGWRGRPFRHGWTKPANRKGVRGRPRKLNAAQLRQLGNVVLQRPRMSYAELHEWVWARFQVRHSHASLKRLLKTECGIAWTGARKKLGEGLKLAELQAAVARAQNEALKNKLVALSQLAEGEQPKTVARASGIHLETLRNWANAYRRSGVAGLAAGD